MRYVNHNKKKWNSFDKFYYYTFTEKRFFDVLFTFQVTFKNRNRLKKSHCLLSSNSSCCIVHTYFFTVNYLLVKDIFIK